MDRPRPSVQRALERSDVIWLSSVRPDRRPHVLPMWFTWDGESIMVFSKPHAQKVRNLRLDPSVMVAIGQPGIDFDVELIDATAELESTPTVDLLSPAFLAKYQQLMARGQLTPERYAEVYSQPITIHPQRWLDWGGRGWVDRPGHPAVRSKSA